jgi:methylglyoxal synthase
MAHLPDVKQIVRLSVAFPVPAGRNLQIAAKRLLALNRIE